MIYKSIKKLIKNILQGISFAFPKKKNLWIFGCWSGLLFADNSKYLYEYIAENHPEIRCIWLTKSDSVLSEMKGKGYECYKRFSWIGIMSALKAEAAFITSDEFLDISPLINSKKTKTIQLWHGVAGKAASWKDKNGNPLFSEKVLKRFSLYYWTASSEKYIEIMNEITNAPKRNFVITGYPRNDTFVTKPKNAIMEEMIKKYENHKFIIYMPTHRNFGHETIDITDFRWIDKWLHEKNIVMVYKPHFMELQNVLHMESEFTNIVLAKDQKIWGDVYSYIHYFDLLISDYSSIAYDFLCAKKPIVLYTYDLEHFKNSDAGLWDFFESVPAGPFCYTWDEVLMNVEKLLSKDIWQEKREECRKLFHPFDDGKNCERGYEAVKNTFLKL